MIRLQPLSQIGGRYCISFAVEYYALYRTRSHFIVHLLNEIATGDCIVDAFYVFDLLGVLIYWIDSPRTLPDDVCCDAGINVEQRSADLYLSKHRSETKTCQWLKCLIEYGYFLNELEVTYHLNHKFAACGAQLRRHLKIWSLCNLVRLYLSDLYAVMSF